MKDAFCVIFHHSRFENWWPSDSDGELQVPVECARFVMEQIKACGAQVKHDDPEPDEDHWFFDIVFESRRITVGICWLPVGSPLRDAWIVQFNAGTLIEKLESSLRSKTHKNSTALALATSLWKQLDKNSEVEGARLIEPEKFRRMY